MMPYSTEPLDRERDSENRNHTCAAHALTWIQGLSMFQRLQTLTAGARKLDMTIPPEARGPSLMGMEASTHIQALAVGLLLYKVQELAP